MFCQKIGQWFSLGLRRGDAVHGMGRERTSEEQHMFLVLVSWLWSLYENSPHEPFSYKRYTSLKCLPKSSRSHLGSNISQGFS